ncbi:MAG: COX15/CtaA family protein [Actinomycetes bacterium]
MSPANIVFSALLVLQVLIIVTGGAVRLTGSGLGCPTWPTCTGKSYTPIAHQAQGKVHSWIEFSNRLLTFVLIVVAIVAVVMAIKKSKGRIDKNRVRILAALQLIGILGQGVLGGITVLTHLNPLPVAGHFLLSIALIAGALSLRHRMADRATIQLLPTTFLLSRILLGLTLVVITLGTIVTGSGPHAGDAQARRFGIDPRTISWIHADSVTALICLAFALFLLVRVSESKEVKEIFGSRLNRFIRICLLQGAIGYIQYFTKLPIVLVAAHLLGSSLVWVNMWNLVYIGKSKTSQES